MPFRPCLQTTFRVGLALLTGVERELLTADFEQVGPLARCCGQGLSATALGQPLHVWCCKGQLAAPTSVYVPVSRLVQCALAMVFADRVRVARRSWAC